MYKLFICASLLVVGVSAKPVKDNLMFEGPGDTATVESTVREARAAPSHISDLIKPGVKDAFLYVYGDAENDDGDVHGYSKKMNDKGQDGYKHHDSFHKKDGDKYGYQKHAEYGQENKAYIEGENNKGIKESFVESGGEKEDEGEESKKSVTIFKEFESDDKKQPKKKAESEYDFFGDGSPDYGNYAGESSNGGEAEEDEAAEDDDGSVETEEAEEADESEESDY